MSFNSWLQNLRSAPGRGQRHHGRRGSLRAATHRLNVEFLEDRCVPALYAVTDLGTLGGGYSYASDVNASGQVAGAAELANGFTHAVLWQDGAAIDLGTLGGGHSESVGINASGQVVGGAYLPGESAYHAFLVTPVDGDANGTPDTWYRDADLNGINDLMRDLGTLGGGLYSAANGINDSGQVAGWTYDALGVQHAFLWNSGAMTDLGVLPGDTMSDATAINSGGSVAGYSVAGYTWSEMLTFDAFLWTPDQPQGTAGTMTSLGTLGGMNSFAYGLNDAGQVVGGAHTTDGSLHAFLAQGGVMQDLGTLPAYPDASSAKDINNAGQVVGDSMVAETVLLYDEWGEPYYETYYYPHAFLWDAAGGMVDLQNQLLPGFDATLQYANAINDGGSIVVNGYYNSSGVSRAFLLTPIPAGTPLISIVDAPTVTEGNAGTRAATFTVNLSEPSDQFVTVDFTTAAGSAAAGSDYQTTSGTLTFAPGEMSKTITVQVNGDRLGEPTETFVVNLSEPTNAPIVDGQGVSTILDDEPRISINDRTVTEGNTGTVNATFTVSLSVAYDVAVTVHYQTANGSATAGSDYAAASVDVTIAAGQTSGTIIVLVNGDRLAEPNETFVVNLGAPTNATIADGQGVGTITDDEPRISISDRTKSEGRRGHTTLFTFTVTLSAAYDQAITMSFATANGTAKTSDSDYIAKTGTLTFNPGETTKTITIEVKGDDKKEANETFYLDLSGLSSNGLFTKSRGVGTILNDD